METPRDMTAGPWEAHPTAHWNEWTIRDGLGRIVATTPGNANTTDQRPGSPYRAESNIANAHVLGAGPELYDVAGDLLEAFEALRRLLYRSEAFAVSRSDATAARDLKRRARVALRKARGEATAS